VNAIDSVARRPRDAEKAHAAAHRRVDDECACDELNSRPIPRDIQREQDIITSRCGNLDAIDSESTGARAEFADQREAVQADERVDAEQLYALPRRTILSRRLDAHEAIAGNARKSQL